MCLSVCVCVCVCLSVSLSLSLSLSVCLSVCVYNPTKLPRRGLCLTSAVSFDCKVDESLRQIVRGRARVWRIEYVCYLRRERGKRKGERERKGEGGGGRGKEEWKRMCKRG